jgi:hypothetical protein
MSFLAGLWWTCKLLFIICILMILVCVFVGLVRTLACMIGPPKRNKEEDNDESTRNRQ